MSSTIVTGAYAGLAAGAILTFLSHVAPLLGAGNFVRDTDEPIAFGRALSRREAHLLGVLIHLILSLFFGVLFAFGVDQGWVSRFEFLPILGYSIVLFFATGLIVMPLEGHGILGMKHDAWFPVDALITNIFWGAFYLLLIRLWLPA